MSDTKIAELKNRLGVISDLFAAIRLLEWDQETYMPPKAAAERAQQLATLSALAHDFFVSSELEHLLESLWDKLETLHPDEQKLIEIVRYDYRRKKRIPKSFVHQFALETSRALQVWVEAREKSDFQLFLPCLEKILELNRQKAELLGYQESPYDALMEDYERGVTTQQLRQLFQRLGDVQSRLVRKICSSGKTVDISWLDGEWDEASKWAFSMQVLRDMGYDLEAGRQDKSVHPFSTSMGLCDVRITTRTAPNDLFHGLMATIHECGHALYSQGHDPKDQRTPLLDGASLGIHESQSRLWENFVGRSLPFWEYYTPILKRHFPDRLEQVTERDVFEALNRVSPSLIRVDADECTYNLHIILRFEMEVDLIEGKLQPREIPEAWNAKVQDLLGIKVPNDSQGCLQDIHWAHGAFGYFPTYALGNLYAAQLWEKIQTDLTDLDQQIAHGVFEPLLHWLRHHVHRHNRRKLPTEIIRDATGQDLDEKPFLRYLENKFGKLYDLKQT